MHIIDNIMVKEMFPLFKLRQLKPQEYQLSNLEESKGLFSAHLFFEQIRHSPLKLSISLLSALKRQRLSKTAFSYVHFIMPLTHPLLNKNSSTLRTV